MHVCIHKQWRQQHMKSRILITGTRKILLLVIINHSCGKWSVPPQKITYSIIFGCSVMRIHEQQHTERSVSFVYYAADKNTTLKYWIKKFNPIRKQSFLILDTVIWMPVLWFNYVKIFWNDNRNRFKKSA